MAKRQEGFTVVEYQETVQPFCRSAFNYDRDKASDESGLKCEDPSLTLQDQKEDADINVILRRFGVTGQMPQGVRMPSYGDFDAVADYRTAMDLVIEAQNAFNRLPAAVRARFSDDPQQLLEFLNDPANLAEARSLGLAVPEKAPAVDVAGKPVQTDLVDEAKKPV